MTGRREREANKQKVTLVCTMIQLIRQWCRLVKSKQWVSGLSVSINKSSGSLIEKSKYQWRRGKNEQRPTRNWFQILGNDWGKTEGPRNTNDENARSIHLKLNSIDLECNWPNLFIICKVTRWNHFNEYLLRHSDYTLKSFRLFFSTLWGAAESCDELR